ncbi:hypothetical protein BCR33DRAFT_426948 [Rhizoclosmatium globosum]|uniref:F-box domain-containing protein n=1 Tax=Rhizoclosmatium globosum TaxID=329046 RepID=A0A1Y2BVI3_9FUNG|nr:hypothetical protein BCR33DRAFT_426948 [Rhizoclosmatium globosum]|eukprot:ORY38637.1 hypothetical protein BCR33DRAFT_426948 [Rhizoclosmatium globosum]
MSQMLPNELIEQIVQWLPPLHRFQLSTAFRFLVIQRQTVPFLEAATPDAASCKGQVDLLNYLKHNSLPFQYSSAAMDGASRYGHVTILQWWADLGEPLLYTKDAMNWASRNGHTQVLEWWKAQKDRYTLQYSDEAMDWAAEHNQSETIKWWLLVSNLWIHCSSKCVDWISRHGNKELLQLWFKQPFVRWFPSLGRPSLDTIDYAPNALILDFWLNQDRASFKSSTMAMDFASQNGNLGVLQWWKDSGLELRFTSAAIDGARENGHIIVLDWWIESAIAAK